MPRNFVYLDNFQAGETGDHGDWLAGYKLFRGILIYNGTWHGSNVIRYIDGTVGPRPGLRQITLGGFATTLTSANSDAALPQSTIYLTSVEGIAALGPIVIDSSDGDQTIYYTGVDVAANTITGCTGGTGDLTTGNAVSQQSIPEGQVLGYGLTQFPGRTAWCVIGTTVYGFDNENGGAVFAYQGSLAITPTAKVVGYQWGPQFVYITSQGDGTYELDVNNGILTRIPNAPGGSCITVYQDRLAIGDLGGVLTNQISFSEPYAPGGSPQLSFGGEHTTIASGSDGNTLPQSTIHVVNAAALNLPAGGGQVTIVDSNGPELITCTGISGDELTGCSGGTGTLSTGDYVDNSDAAFIQVGDAWDVRFMVTQRTHLLIGKDNGWFIFQGDINVNATLRVALQTWGPIDQDHAFATQTGLVWYIPLFHDCPTEFTGTAMSQLRYLHVDGDVYEESVFPAPPMYGASALGQVQDGIFVSSYNASTPNFGVLLHNGAWSYLNFGVDISGYVAHASDRFYICDGGGDSVTPLFYVMLTDLDRAVKSTDNLARPGDANAEYLGNSLLLPEWESRDGSEVVIRAVLVQIKKWNTGSSQSNHLEMTVTSTAQEYNDGDSRGGESSITQEWDEAPSETEFDGQYQDLTFRVGDQGSGNGFRLEFANLRGVSIRKIQVILDQNDTRV